MKNMHKSSNPCVSVIIPNYNHEKFLIQRIESILHQTFQNFELIILDDCSTDNSKTIIENYRHHEKVTAIVYNEHNSGSTFKQWEKGIEIAQGEWIWMAESDDWCESTFLEVVVDGLTKNAKCVVGFCQSCVVSDDGTILWQTHASKLLEYHAGADFVNNRLLYVCEIVNASSVVWKKNEFKNITKGYTTFRACGDWLFWLEVARRGEIMISGRMLNYFRKYDDSFTEHSFVSGLHFTESIRMGKYLLEQKFIDEATFKKSMKSRYEQFYQRRSQMTLQKAKEINQLFKHERVRTRSLNKYGFFTKVQRRLRSALKRRLLARFFI
ncbi:MAG: glycosyltransferase family 2 protein [Chitinophagaceae bacterium]|nr:MAG: glycosyltransferase family 2 protein [Chitinophagaceae bacterium]